MSSELEQRLQRVLTGVEPGAAATEQARAAVMATGGGRLRSRYGLALVAAALVAALLTTGVTLAASRTAREAVGLEGGRPRNHLPRPIHAPLPPGANGFATVIGRSVWVATPNRGRPATGRFAGFELSPNAVYAAVGVRGALLALDPASLRTVKRHPVDGTPVAISWAPIGIHIAYIARRGDGYSLHLIDGDLTHDRVVARHVSPVKPAWRWDSLAVAYTTSAGSVRVLDLGHGRTTTLAAPRSCDRNPPSQLAFAPRGTMLAVAVGSDAWAADTAGSRRLCLPPIATNGITTSGGLAWVSRSDLVLTTFQFIQRDRILPHGGEVVRRVQAPGGIVAIAASPDRRSLALALAGDTTYVVMVDVPDAHTATEWSRKGAHTLPPRQLLLVAAGTAGRRPPVTLIWR